MLLAGWACRALPWPPGTARKLVIAVAVFIAVAAVKLPPAPERDSQVATPAMRALMAREHVQAGLAAYWSSNEITYLSGGRVRLRSITPDGYAFPWINSIEDYTGHKGEEPPAFRWIYMKGLNPSSIRARFGDPGKIIQTPSNESIWLYASGDAIRFSPARQALENRHSSAADIVFHSAAAGLPSLTGTKEEWAVVARQPSDKANYLTYGPYLHLAPGRYLVIFDYQYDKPPMKDKEALYDCCITIPDGVKTLDRSRVPYAGAGPQTLVRDVVVPETGTVPEKCFFEARIYYPGSGDLRIDGLTIRRVDAP
jgi:hypothetical protein